MVALLSPAGARPCRARAARGRARGAARARRARAAASQQARRAGGAAPDASAALRALPLWVGSAGVLGLALNRAWLFTHPVAAAATGNAGRLLKLAAEGSQTRADVLCLLCAASLVFTGLSWKAIESRRPELVKPQGDDCLAFQEVLPAEARRELEWAWTAAAASTSCVSMAVFYNGECVMQAGARAPAGGAADERPDELAAAVRGRSIEEITGPIVLRAMEKGRGNYLANLILFPGRDEFFAYFPKNLQGVLVHPVGDNGVLVAGTDTQRGFSRLDQAWLGDIADKLDSTLS